MSTCKVCSAQYYKGLKADGKDYDHKCSDYILRLIQEIVGLKSFSQAKEALH